MTRLRDQIYDAGLFVRDLANCMTREEVVELARKLNELRKYEDVQPCEFTNYVISRIIELHYKVTDKI